MPSFLLEQHKPYQREYDWDTLLYIMHDPFEVYWNNRVQIPELMELNDWTGRDKLFCVDENWHPDRDVLDNAKRYMRTEANNLDIWELDKEAELNQMIDKIDAAIRTPHHIQTTILRPILQRAPKFFPKWYVRYILYGDTPVKPKVQWDYVEW